jgi:hypothetical protein
MVNVNTMKKKKLSEEMILTVLGDVVRMLIWFCYFNNKGHYKLYCYNMDSFFLLAFGNAGKTLALVAIILFFILLYIKKSIWKSVGLSIWYIVRFFWRMCIFPLRLTIICFKLFAIMLRTLGSLIKLPRKIEVFLVSAMLYIVGLVNIIRSDDILTLQLSLCFILVFMLCIWEWLYLWSKDPYWWVYGFGLPSLFDNLFNHWEKNNIQDKISKSDGKNANDKEIIEIKKSIWQEFNLFNLCHKKFNPIINKRTMLQQYLVVLLVAAIITIITFAFGYYDIQKLNPHSFCGMNTGISECLYFSTITFFNYGMGDYNLVGAGVKVLLILELFSFLFLLTITILAFSAASEEGARETIDFVQGKIEDRRRKIVILLEEKFHIDEKQLMLYKEEDFDKEIKGGKLQSQVFQAEVVDACSNGEEDEEINKRIMLLESSGSWDEAARRTQLLLELQDKFTDSDITRIVDIILNNSQILSSFAARPLLKNFFAKNTRIIPEDKLKAFLSNIK